MSTELIINASLPETRIALMEDGEIQDLLIERASGKGIVGNIYKGRVTRVLPGMQAAFVDIGLEKAAFLYVDDVYVHSEIWEEEEGSVNEQGAMAEVTDSETSAAPPNAAASPVTDPGADPNSPQATAPADGVTAAASGEARPEGEEAPGHEPEMDHDEIAGDPADQDDDEDEIEEIDDDEDVGDFEGDDLDDDDDDDQGPMRMGPDEGGNDDNVGNRTVAPREGESSGSGESQPQPVIRPVVPGEGRGGESAEGVSQEAGSGAQGEGQGEGQGRDGGRRRHRRGRRGGRFRRRDGREEKGPNPQQEAQGGQVSGAQEPATDYPGNFQDQVHDEGDVGSDRAEMAEAGQQIAQPVEPRAAEEGDTAAAGRPVVARALEAEGRRQSTINKQDFKAQRGRDRRIKPKATTRPSRGQVNIQDLLKEGQEVIVQVAKDPISTKGARLTCHISLPGRHLVCMPTIDHVGVSRRIERDDERRRLRDFVERNRPKNLGFIVRTASGRQAAAEKRIKQDIDYLTRLWSEIREKAANVSAPALVYEDLNSVLRAIRDWVTEDIDKIVVDSRYHFNEIQRFVSHFMPSLRQKVDLYHGDIPIFDAYNISTELSRALERKVWLKSGGYIVIDQAEALVAIDVNTGRYVGKKNLEDTILKTNLEAVQEIAYQLRLRNCGGIIILDLIDMEKEENKQRVYRALEEALKKDRSRPSILKISELGLVEMTRKRTRDTMVRTLCEPCSHCEGKGYIKGKQTVAYEIMREVEREGIEKDVSKILVQSHPDVIDILAIDERETLDHLERRYRKQIYLQAVGDFHPEQFEVMGDKKDKAELAREGRDSGRNRDRGRNEREEGGERERGGKNRRDRGRGRDRDRDRNRGERDQQQARDRDSQQSGERGEVIRPLAGAGDLSEAQIMANEAGSEAMLDSGSMNAAGFPSEHTGAVGEVRIAPRTATPDFDNEEDRLAFLRAQAAQDAALARMQGAGGANNRDRNRDRGPGGVNAAGGGQQGGAPRGDDDRGGGGRRRRGRRGGKFRRGSKPQRFGGAPVQGGAPQPGGAGPEGSGGGSGAAPSGGGDSSGGGGGGGGEAPNT